MTAWPTHLTSSENTCWNQSLSFHSSQYSFPCCFPAPWPCWKLRAVPDTTGLAGERVYPMHSQDQALCMCWEMLSKYGTLWVCSAFWVFPLMPAIHTNPGAWVPGTSQVNRAQRPSGMRIFPIMMTRLELYWILVFLSKTHSLSTYPRTWAVQEFVILRTARLFKITIHRSTLGMPLCHCVLSFWDGKSKLPVLLL